MQESEEGIIVMEKEIQSLRLQLEQIDQENKRLRDLLVNMSKDNSVVMCNTCTTILTMFL